MPGCVGSVEGDEMLVVDCQVPFRLGCLIDGVQPYPPGGKARDVAAIRGGADHSL